ncbi:MFS transporter, putative [Talaromyces stipitatus ATCC 10500]|uniref:MFS transporter, putative n=1 Tax=Talaromyces stipitatus (strain ATCC 10500 / CBS 375.48 / QM 6759 / NRRL 1006) TaxID=441959 RepID=B8M7X7_TALSN|nr:MFS transporter, putative [Talaromyces stipitatus ATCC 10500]EED19856.1 MFS transporter, putative [Talaromyces stipitatus ATCC 10500]
MSNLIAGDEEKSAPVDGDAIAPTETAPVPHTSNQAEQEKKSSAIPNLEGNTGNQSGDSEQGRRPSRAADGPYCILAERQKVFIFQGIAPSFIGNFSDIHGRRPAYLICFTIYLAANIGLEIQNDYAALMVLRCLQSSGSSGTIALGSATVADISTRAERGKYIGYATMGVTLGPALGPIIGGLIDHYLGWRWIFRFLIILAGVYATFLVVFLPETCRAVVGDGSVPTAKWNRSVWQIVSSKLQPSKIKEPNYDSVQKRKRRPNVFASALIATEKEPAIILAYGSLIYCGYMSVLSTLTSQLKTQYGFNSIQIGLCYLPLGCGSLTSRWTVGFLLDWNFKREAARQGMPIIKNRQQNIEKFNIEVARLAITIPFVYGGALCLIAYGWVMQFKTSLPGPMVMLFFMGHLTTGAFSSLNTLIVDTQPGSPATAVAANNLWRCLTAAGAVAAAGPLIERIGIGWTASFIAFLWLLFSPLMWAVYKMGYVWRENLRKKREHSV